MPPRLWLSGRSAALKFSVLSRNGEGTTEHAQTCTHRRSRVVIVTVLCFCGDAWRGDLRHTMAVACRSSLQSLGSSDRCPQSRRYQIPLSQSWDGSLVQEPPSGFFRSVGFLQGGGGGARGSGCCRASCQPSLASQSFLLQSSSSCRATLSFSESLS